jgi:hypothetical protein
MYRKKLSFALKPQPQPERIVVAVPPAEKPMRPIFTSAALVKSAKKTLKQSPLSPKEAAWARIKRALDAPQNKDFNGSSRDY